MNPWCVSQINTSPRIRTIRRDSRRITSTSLGSLDIRRPRETLYGDGSIVDRETIRPSAFDTIFCVTATISFGARAKPVRRMASLRHSPTFIPDVISGTWATGKISSFIDGRLDIARFRNLCADPESRRRDPPAYRYRKRYPADP